MINPLTHYELDMATRQQEQLGRSAHAPAAGTDGAPGSLLSGLRDMVAEKGTRPWFDAEQLSETVALKRHGVPIHKSL